MDRQPDTRPSLRVIAGDLIDAATPPPFGVVDLDVPALSRSGSPGGQAHRRPARSGSAKPPHIVVVGGGVSGLAAAWHLVRDGSEPAQVTVLESADQVGGKLRVSEIEGIAADEGAESMLAIRPEAVGLTRAVGLGADIVSPATSQAAVLSRGVLRPLPAGLITGIPTDLRTLAASGIISIPGLIRMPLDHWLPHTPIDGDISVGDFVTTRLGREIVERLVEPMLAGVYAGRADDLSLEMAVPALFRRAKRERSLLRAARDVRSTGAFPSGARSRGPVFAGLSGGMGRLPKAITEQLRLRGVRIATGTSATGLRPTPSGWRLLISAPGGSGKPEPMDADAVVLAVPAPSAARLLRRANASAAALLDAVDYASVAVVTLAYRPSSVPASVQGSGFLVPPVEGLAIKAATFASRKWAWLARTGAVSASAADEASAHEQPAPQRLDIVRVSFGRFGETEILQRTDDELAALAAAELGLTCGLPLHPVASRVSRWGGALPQYAVGHRGRIGQLRELLVSTPGVSVCGAAYDGVGIAACIGSAQFAAGQVQAHLAERGQWAHV